MGRLLSLDDRPALVPGIVGAKAAGLARAKAAGLPVLPGWVLPCEEGGTAAARGASILNAGGTSSAACLAVVGLALDGALRSRAVQAVEELGGRIIVRSSTSIEADPRWSGAFSSYHDVGSDELEAAIRGCWASPFARDALERAEAEGVPPGSIRVAVLLQPWVAFEAGGTATASASGAVSVTAANGAPAELVAGRIAGVTVRMGGADRSAGTPAGGPGVEVLRDVARLANEVRAATGDDAIEWGLSDGQVIVLQARRAATPVPRAVTPGPAMAYPPRARDVAALAASYPGPFGEAIVLAWALASAGPLPEPAPVPVDDTATALAEIEARAAALIAAAWARGVPQARAAATETFRAILGPDPVGALALLPAARLDPRPMGELLGLVRGLGEALARARLLPHPSLLLRVEPGGLAHAIARGERPIVRRGPDRWEPFVADVVRSAGGGHRGDPAAGGIAAGRLQIIAGPGAARPHPRAVLAVSSPAPGVAPLLWGCAGLITAGGSVGAHLFEVARSLGVPAVVGVDLAAVGAREGDLVAIDGDAGVVSLLGTNASASSGREQRGA